MANVLQMHEQQSIATLSKQGWSIRRIARELNLHRYTVRRYIQAERSAAKCTTISTAGNDPKCTISTTGKMGRKCACDRLVETISGKEILPCWPRTPEHKGKVESSVGYVKDNALKGRVFDALAAQNQFLTQWEKTVADLRIHGTTKCQVAQRFAEEQKHLRPLPASLFPVFQEAPRTVHRDSYVEVAKAYYAVPPEYIGQKVWVRWDTREVRVFNLRWEQVQVHRRLEPGQFSKVLGIGGGQGTLQANLEYWSGRARELGTDCAHWSQSLVQQRGVEAIRSLMGLVGLCDRHSFRAVNTACAQAAAQGAWRLRDVRALLEATHVQTELSFQQHHPLIRNLSEYGLFIKAQNL